MNKQTTSRIRRMVWAVLLIGGLVAVGAWFFLDRGSALSIASGDVVEMVETTASETVAAKLPTISADGYVMPAHYALLSFAASNTVASIDVAEGDWVEAGATLITLENSAQRAALAQAEANLAQAQANLERSRAGARAEEIAQAQAAAEVAELNLYRLVEGATAEQVASADKVIVAAQANLARVQAGATPAEITAAEATLRQAEASLRNAQSAYNQVSWANDIGARPESLRLEQASVEYERAKAQYENVVAGATAEDIWVAQTQVAQVQAAKDELTAAAHPADVARAQANVRSVAAALDLLEAGARPEEIVAAQAQVAAAEAAVAQAQAALATTILTAPFAGEVSSIAVHAGEFVAPGAPVIRLGDTQAWVIETDTLSELDVVALREGDAMAVTVDALPGVTFRGKVDHIQPASDLKRGDVTYAVTIALDAEEAALNDLRWGMSAAVTK